MLAYLLKVSPDVEKIRSVVRKRLLDQPRIEAGMKQLTRMLVTLHEKGFVKLDPEPPAEATAKDPTPQPPPPGGEGEKDRKPTLLEEALAAQRGSPPPSLLGKGVGGLGSEPAYQPLTATPTPELDKLLVFRACHPLYGAFLIDLLGVASREERIQLLESVLELPRPLLKFVRVPFEMSPGPLQTTVLDPELIAKGLITATPPKEEGAEAEEEWVPWDERPPGLAEKARLLFDAKYPEVGDFVTTAVWAAGEILNYGNFNTYVTTKDLTKQEGLIFRHLLRLILLTQEFEQLTPPGLTAEDWKKELAEISDKLTDICRAVDPTSTEEAIKKAHAADVVEGEEHAKVVVATQPEQPPKPAEPEEDADAFGARDRGLGSFAYRSRWCPSPAAARRPLPSGERCRTAEPLSYPTRVARKARWEMGLTHLSPLGRGRRVALHAAGEEPRDTTETTKAFSTVTRTPRLMKNTAVLLITCPDRKGIVAAVAEFLYKHDANILHADQHQDAERNLFLMRVEWGLDGFTLDPAEFPRRFAPLADRFEMRWRLERSDHPIRVALFVSKYDHCLMDLLYRHQTGELPCHVPLIIANHPEAEKWGRFYNVPFHTSPPRRARGRLRAEAVGVARRGEDRPRGDGAVCKPSSSKEFIRRYPHRIINVHHSFLPAFVGAEALPTAHSSAAGVKLIGATSHYATQDLDEGPIIEQDVIRISHRDGLDELLQKGRDLEKVVLSRAVRWHIDHRVLVYDRKTVIFD